MPFKEFPVIENLKQLYFEEYFDSLNAKASYFFKLTSLII